MKRGVTVALQAVRSSQAAGSRTISARFSRSYEIATHADAAYITSAPFEFVRWVAGALASRSGGISCDNSYETITTQTGNVGCQVEVWKADAAESRGDPSKASFTCTWVSIGGICCAWDWWAAPTDVCGIQNESRFAETSGCRVVPDEVEGGVTDAGVGYGGVFYHSNQIVAGRARSRG